MQLSVSKNDADLVCIRCAGTIREDDVQVPTHPLEALLGPGVYSRRVLMSLELTGYVDSSGVGWLIGCHKRCLQAGGRFVLYSVPPMVTQILRVLRIDSLLTIAGNEAEARILALQ
jgi:anti-sigma B factor antagonist